MGAQLPLVGYGLFADVPLAWFHATRADPRPDGSFLVHTTDPPRTFDLRLRTPAAGVRRGGRHAERPHRGARSPGRRSSTTAGSGSSASASAATPSTRPGASSSSGTRRARSPPGGSGPYTEPLLGEQWQGPPPVGPSSNFTMPWMVSSRGYGFLLDSTWLNRFDLTSHGPLAGGDRGAGPALARLRGPRARRRAARVTTDPLVGRQPPPAKWFFGPWYQPTGDDRVPRLRSAPGGARPSRRAGYDVPVTVAQTYTHYLPCGAQAGGRAAGQGAGQRRRLPLVGLPGDDVRQLVRLPGPPRRRLRDRRGQRLVRQDARSAPPTPCPTSPSSTRRRRSSTSPPPGAVGWWQSLIQEALDDGYDGWMEDFGEFVAPDSVLADGRSGPRGPQRLLHRLPPRRATSSPGPARARTSRSSCAAATRARGRWPGSCGAATPPRTTPRPTGSRPP